MRAIWRFHGISDANRTTPGARGSNMGKPQTLISGRKSLVWFVVALFVMLVGPGRSGPTAAACGGSNLR